MGNVIKLKGDPTFNEEESALEALTPGHLVMITATGVQRNTAAAANVAPAFAMERSELGLGIDDAYAIGDKVLVGTFKPGERVNAFLASGQNVANGAYLTTNNLGLLTAAGVTAGLRLARALEAKDASGAAPVAGTRIRVEIV